MQELWGHTFSFKSASSSSPDPDDSSDEEVALARSEENLQWSAAIKNLNQSMPLCLPNHRTCTNLWVKDGISKMEEDTTGLGGGKRNGRRREGAARRRREEEDWGPVRGWTGRGREEARSREHRCRRGRCCKRRRRHGARCWLRRLLPSPFSGFQIGLAFACLPSKMPKWFGHPTSVHYPIDRWQMDFFLLVACLSWYHRDKRICDPGTLRVILFLGWKEELIFMFLIFFCK